MEEKTLVQVNKSTLEKLKLIGKMGWSYDNAINFLIEEHQKYQIPEKKISEKDAK